MAAIVGYNNNLENFKQFKFGNIDTTEVSTTDSESSSSEDKKTDKEKLLDEGGWMTPQEYYSNMSTTSSDTQGSADSEGEIMYGSSSSKVDYFWVEDLKNWARYTVSFEENCKNIFELNVWNGKNDWIPVIAASTPYNLKHIFIILPRLDTYGIGNLQNKFFETNKIDYIIQYRGITQEILPIQDASLHSEYDNKNAFMQVVNGIRLKKHFKYGINDSAKFKTIAYGTSYYFGDQDATWEHFAQSNFRSSVLIGCPPVWRSPTGEIILCTRLEWNSDPGHSYYYKVRANSKDKGFKKYYNAYYCSNRSAYLKQIMKNDTIESANWLNSKCRDFFGSGNDKTIEYDWLQEYNRTVDKSEYSSGSGKPGSMLNSELLFEQHNINKENSLKCSFRINRPVITTTERPAPEYVKKW